MGPCIPYPLHTHCPPHTHTQPGPAAREAGWAGMHSGYWLPSTSALSVLGGNGKGGAWQGCLAPRACSMSSTMPEPSLGDWIPWQDGGRGWGPDRWITLIGQIKRCPGSHPSQRFPPRAQHFLAELNAARPQALISSDHQLPALAGHPALLRAPGRGGAPHLFLCSACLFWASLQLVLSFVLAPCPHIKQTEHNNLGPSLYLFPVFPLYLLSNCFGPSASPRVTRCPDFIGTVLVFGSFSYIGSYYPPPPVLIFHICCLVTLGPPHPSVCFTPSCRLGVNKSERRQPNGSVGQPPGGAGRQAVVLAPVPGRSWGKHSGCRKAVARH
ncbi:unnamed protein product [Eretmochelys imbricata]